MNIFKDTHNKDLATVVLYGSSNALYHDAACEKAVTYEEMSNILKAHTPFVVNTGNASMTEFAYPVITQEGKVSDTPTIYVTTIEVTTSDLSTVVAPVVYTVEAE